MTPRLCSIAQDFGPAQFLLLFAMLSCESSHSLEDANADAARRATLEQAGVQIPFGAPLVVRKDVKVAPGDYVRKPLGIDAKRGVIIAVSVHDATIDLSGVNLRGTAPGTDLDENFGFGILLEDCANITLRGGTIGGFKDCIVANRCKNLTLDGVRFDGWYGAHLRSTTTMEDPTDWLYPHENDHGEWIDNYGSAIALTDCENATVSNCSGRHGQNGILLVRSNGCRVFDDDFSFLSGWGLALYRSSKNVVSRNAFDYCVRGYSHDLYWRGQDSAGILVFERCSDNLFVENSATHSGDGLFLFAGNDTVLGRAFDKGEIDAGGSDRNICYKNDFSFAVANAIEATFSKDNWAIENKLDGSRQHGVWGGYSSRMVILKNEIDATQGGGVSIEHGQECAIADNSFQKNDIGVELWWNENKELVQGPFGKHRDTSSRDHWVLANTFDENIQDVVLKQTTGVAFAKNRFPPHGREMYIDKLESAEGEPPKGQSAKDWMMADDGARPSGHASDSTVKRASGEPEWLKRAREWKCPEVPGVHKPAAAERETAGLETILVGEWGPWDWKSGEAKPKPRVPGGVLVDARWDATWFSWAGAVDPRTSSSAWHELASRPLEHKSVANFVNPWAGDDDVKKKVGSDHFGLLATTSVTLKEGGKYRLSAVSDDGVRITLDGKTVLENWTWHAPMRDQAELEIAAGTHAIGLEYFQIDGASALSIELDRIAKP